MKTNGFDDFISKCKKDHSKEIEEAVKDIALKTIRDVRSNTPVDTGVLKRSWNLKREGNNKVVLYNLTPYAIHVEYGHRVKGSKGEFYKDKATGQIRFKKARVVKGLHMLRNSTNRAGIYTKKRYSKLIKDMMR